MAATQSAAAVTATPGSYVSVAPVRLVDTRYGTGTPKARIPGGGTLSLQVGGTAGIPATGVAAVVMTLNVLGATTGGRLTVWAAGTAQRPNVSSLNFAVGQAATSAVTSQLASSAD